MSTAKHAPRNPFRTPTDEHTNAVKNSLLRSILYVAVVTALVLALATLFSLPSPHRTIRFSSSIRNYMYYNNDKAPNTTMMTVARPRVRGSATGDRNMARSRTHLSDDNEQEDSHEEDLVMLQQADPAGANLKILGQTKQQVKQEIESEELSDHAFGLEHASTKDVPELNNLLQQVVHVVFRKGEQEVVPEQQHAAYVSTARQPLSSRSARSRSQSIEISTGDERGGAGLSELNRDESAEVQ